MPEPVDVRFDEIGYWSEIKLEILREYAAAYSMILNSQPQLYHCYIDAFAGKGVHFSSTKGQFVPGSPMNALHVNPRFREYFLIDLDGQNVSQLRTLIGARDDVHLFEGDCNEILINEVLPQMRYEDYRRALCLLDPYGLHLDWDVMQFAGSLNTVEIFLNFPIMDMNRNVLWRNPDEVPAIQVERMNRFWGDESWRTAAYQKERTLFENVDVKQSNDAVVEAFRKRLQDEAGFKYVPKPLPMRNRNGATVYYLFFASPKETGAKIARDIFRKYAGREK